MSYRKNKTVNEINTGTTVVAIQFDRGYIFLGDVQVTSAMGRAECTGKTFQFNQNIIFGIAGNVSEIRILISMLRSNITKLYGDINAATLYPIGGARMESLMAHLSMSNQIPAESAFLVAYIPSPGATPYGFTTEGLYPITPIYRYHAIGSGSIYATPILDNRWREGMNYEEALELATEVVSIAANHDLYSNGSELYGHSITIDGIQPIRVPRGDTNRPPLRLNEFNSR